MREFFKSSSNRVAIVLFIGLVLLIAHYPGQPLLKYVFLPRIGMALLLGTTAILVIFHWRKLKQGSLGPKSIWIPLAVIAGSGVARLVVQQDLYTLAGACFMVSMFGLYVVSRQYGEKALNLFMPLVIVGAIGIIMDAAVSGNAKNSGLFTNYASAAEFLVFGFIVSPRKYQWWLSAIVITGLFFSGAEEGIFYVAVVGVAVLLRRDWSRKLLLPVGILAGLLVVCTALGITQQLTGRAVTMVESAYIVVTDNSLTIEERDALLDVALNGRWTNGWKIQRAIKPLGYGVDITHLSKAIPHNIILMVTDQLGPIATVAWVAFIIAGVKNTKWKYGFLVIAMLGVWQPYVWTIMLPWSWVLAGAATGSSASDYIFKGVVATQ